jgi:hypothetical protein
MVALRGIYDGKTIRLLLSELPPEMQGEISVAVLGLIVAIRRSPREDRRLAFTCERL